MTPLELLPRLAQGKYYGYSSEVRLLQKYSKENNVVAYIKISNKKTKRDKKTQDER